MSIIKPALKLFLVAAIATTLLTLTHALTLEPIAANNKVAQEKLMKDIFKQATVFNEITAEKSGNINRIFEALNDDRLIGHVIELSPVGYAGTINMIVGISKTDDVVAGVRVLKHKETPGLGALIVTEKFYRKYDGRKLVPLRVVRTSPSENEIDAITSATISTRVVTNAVNEAIEWYQRSGLK
jgi:electron transport complex protein RnfG